MFRQREIVGVRDRVKERGRILSLFTIKQYEDIKHRLRPKNNIICQQNLFRRNVDFDLNMNKEQDYYDLREP